MTLFSPTAIDLSRLPPPNAIEPLDYETLFQAFIARFKAAWAGLRAADPTLPDYDVEALETDPAAIVGQAWSYLRLLDRARVNDAVRAVLAPFAKGTNLDAVAARANVQRLVVAPATPTTPAVMESDERLLLRYLMAFDRPSAGSADRYLYEAYTAWPALHDAAVIGHAVHGRRGDTDVVIVGPGGREPTAAELQLVRDAVTAPHVQPEAVAVAVLPAQRALYDVALAIDVSNGPDASLIQQEAEARVRTVADERTRIGAEVPLNLLTGAAYGPGVISVRSTAPAASIAARPYAIPVCTGISVVTEVRG